MTIFCVTVSDPIDGDQTSRKRPTPSNDDDHDDDSAKRPTSSPIPSTSSWNENMNEPCQSTSTANVMRGNCVNCRVPVSESPLCSRCLNLPRCKVCKRHLPENCFVQSDLCHVCDRKRKSIRHTHAVDDVIAEVSLDINTDVDQSFDSYVQRNEGTISDVITSQQNGHGSIRVVIRTTVEFSRHLSEEQDDLQLVSGYFTSMPQLVAAGHGFDIHQLLAELNAAVEGFNARGSGFIFNRLLEFTIVVTQFRPLAGSTFVPTPLAIERKKAIVNVQNSDLHCFEHSINAFLHPAKDHPYRVSNYIKYMGTLNFDNIPFPVAVKDIPKFEKQNPEISVNVISPDPDNKGFSIDYVSAERQRRHHVNLLLLHDPQTGTHHYTLIKNFSRLVAGRTKHHSDNYVCNSCLNVFSSQRVLDQHVEKCLSHKPQMVVYPDPSDPDECKLRFKDHKKQHPMSFYLVCDFESFLVPNQCNQADTNTKADETDTNIESDTESDPDTKNKSRILDEHVVSGFCCHRMTDVPQYQTPPTVYSGPDVMSKPIKLIQMPSPTLKAILTLKTSRAYSTNTS